MACVANACLDASGHGNPDAFPVPPEMQGQELEVTVYVDPLDYIRMRTIGGIIERYPCIRVGVGSMENSA